MKWLLLFAGTDFLIIIVNPAVTSGLLLIIPGERFIKQFVINCLYIFIAVVDIEMSTSSVYIFCSELSAIVIDRAFTDHCTYRSLHFFISHL